MVEALLGEGTEIPERRPCRVTREELERARRVVSFGCDLDDLLPPGRAVDRWDDVPSVRDEFSAARDRIVARVQRLLNDLAVPRT